MKKQAILLLLLILSISTFAQSGLNDYKLMEIPSKFEFQKEKDQYRINTTLKLFFKQKGFEVFFNDEIQSPDFAASNCNKMFVSIVDSSTMLVTKLTIEIKDCTNKVLFTSEQGTSRRKDFGTAYNESLRIALKSFEKANYKYKAKVKTEANTQIQVDTVKAVPVATEKPKATAMSLQKTSNPDVYIASFDGKNGVALKKADGWYFEYYENDTLVSEKLNMKL